jgi:hypothetical protein
LWLIINVLILAKDWKERGFYEGSINLFQHAFYREIQLRGGKCSAINHYFIGIISGIIVMHRYIKEKQIVRKQKRRKKGKCIYIRKRINETGKCKYNTFTYYVG